jgi:hypothetical protein
MAHMGSRCNVRYKACLLVLRLTQISRKPAAYAMSDAALENGASRNPVL